MLAALQQTSESTYCVGERLRRLDRVGADIDDRLERLRREVPSADLAAWVAAQLMFEDVVDGPNRGRCSKKPVPEPVHEPDRSGHALPATRCLTLVPVPKSAMSEAAREQAAYQASIRTIRSRERPLYLVRPGLDGSWVVDGYPWLSIDANDRRSARDATRAAVAAWLGVEADAFEVKSP